MNGGNIFKRKTKVIDDEEDGIENEENKLEKEEKEEKNVEFQEKKESIISSNQQKQNISAPGISSIKKKENRVQSESAPNKEVSIVDKINMLKKKNKQEHLKDIVSAGKSNGLKQQESGHKSSSATKYNVKKVPLVKEDEKKGNISMKKKIVSESEDSEDSDFRSGESEDSSYSSSEESDSSSGSESSSEEIERPIKKLEKKKVSTSTPKKKIEKVKQIHQSSIKKPETKSKSSGKVLKTKSSLVNQLLKRWWFALPKWPADDYDPSEKLKCLKLRPIDKSEWKLEQIVDENGFTKCVELDGYKCVFIDHSGKVHDLRPQETRPSYNNFINKPERELYQLLIKAITNQINELQNGEKYCKEDYQIIDDLKEELETVESNYARLK